jgi:septal ring factor EnvC (AmiA/AmiB activator)
VRRPLHSALIALACWAAVAAQEPAKDAEEAIRLLAQQVGDIAGKQQGVLDRLELLKRRVRLDELMLQRIQNQQAQTQRAVAQAEERSRQLAEREGAARSYLLRRMRQQYALGVLQQYRLLFAANSTQDLRTAGFYLSYLGTRDAKSLQVIHTLRRDQEQARAELQAAQERLARQSEEAARERDSLRAEETNLSRLLDQLGRERQTAQAGLDETLAAAKAMDRYVNDLAFRTRVDLFSQNMAAARGSLPFPCRGKVIRGFGEFVHPRFRTRVPHPGLDIASPLGAPACAVFGGVVEFADWLSGYGYTVILSHPGGFFTVYGHLDQIRVKKDATVAQGQPVGLVGQSAALETSSLYFELRQGGKAVDPLVWLKGGSHAPK